MLKVFAKRAIKAFGRRWNYDSSYLTEILDETGIDAILPLNALGKVSAYQCGLPASVYHASKIAASIAADCGPCAQLCISMAQAAGVDERTLRALAAGDADELGVDERMAYDFTRGILARDDVSELRAAIAKRWGTRALVSLAYGIISAQAYPTFKYVTGYAHACTRLHVAGVDIGVREQAFV
jgi:AhpD family alkylhydroperoxidase